MDDSRCLIRLPDDSNQLVKLSITAAMSLYELLLLSTAYIFELSKLYYALPSGKSYRAERL